MFSNDLLYLQYYTRLVEWTLYSEVRHLDKGICETEYFYESKKIGKPVLLPISSFFAQLTNRVVKKDRDLIKTFVAAIFLSRLIHSFAANLQRKRIICVTR